MCISSRRRNAFLMNLIGDNNRKKEVVHGEFTNGYARA
jgi:hypothetical protein